MVREFKDVLVADDDPILRGVLAEIFRECGWFVRTASDGFSALSAMRGKMPDLLLSDLNMPGMSGYELLSVVRRRFPQVRVIAMSGAHSDSDVPLNVAADAFYPKGACSMARLLDLVAGLRTALTVEDKRRSSPAWVPAIRSSVMDDREIGLTCTECLRALAFVPIGDRPTEQDVCCPHCGHMLSVLLLWEEPTSSSWTNPRDLSATFANRSAFANARQPLFLPLQVGAR